jgi:quinol monooxygenase YgiN
MFYLNVILKVKDPAHVAQVRDALARMRPLCLAENGCERWDAYQSESVPESFLLNEHWSTRELWEIHLQGPALTEIYLKEVRPVVEREVHPSRMVT